MSKQADISFPKELLVVIIQFKPGEEQNNAIRIIFGREREEKNESN